MKKSVDGETCHNDKPGRGARKDGGGTEEKEHGGPATRPSRACKEENGGLEIRKAGPATMTSRACSEDGRRNGGTCHNDKPGLWVGKGGLRSYEGWVG